jgi:3-oxoacyl-[acyl-carrier protein] reductase
MPFSEEFNTSPAWEHTGEATLEEPEAQAIAEGYRGKVALVTGGATGLGRAIAMEFGRRGCKVAFCYLDLPGRDVTEQALLTETTLAGMGVHVYAGRCDVRDRLAVEHFVNETIARLGGLHYLVNNAGIAVDGALWRLSERAWAEVLETNVTGAFNCIRASAQHFRAQHYGKVVSVSAHTAARPGFGVANYAASKAAVEGLTRAAAVDLGSANINVNAVAPGFIRTERMELLPSDVVERSQAKSVLGRLADPEDIARVIAFLCSEEARHITGQTLVVDGGMSLG